MLDRTLHRRPTAERLPHPGRPKTVAVVASVVALLLPAGALASGFALFEHGPRLAGTAYAGAGSAGFDASGMFFNSATLTLLERTEVVVGGHYLSTTNDFSGCAFYDPDNPLIAGTPLAGAPLVGDRTVDGGDATAVPNLFGAWVLDERWRVGIGLSSPFGLITDYPRGWVGRYHALRSELVTVNVNPAFALRISDSLSFGAGVDLLWADVELGQAIDFGLLAAQAGVPGARPGDPSQDGRVVTGGDDEGYGWNAGVLWQPTGRARFGLSWRSSIDIDFEGDGRFEVPAIGRPLTATGAFTDTTARSGITLPESLTASATFELDKRWRLLSDVTWRRWSHFEELRIDFDNPAQDASVIPLDWEDSWRIAAGATWQASESLLLRFGLAFDEEAVSDPARRTPRVPDTDRTWVAAGLGYRFGGFELDLAYTHLFGADAELDVTDARAPGLPTDVHRLQGTIESSVDIVSVSGRWRFGAGGS